MPHKPLVTNEPDIDHVESDFGDPESIDFILKLGRALHQYGSAAHRLEDVVDHVSVKLGLDAQVFSQPTSLFAAFGQLGTQRPFHEPTGEIGPGDGLVPGVWGAGTSISGPGVGIPGGGSVGCPGCDGSGVAGAGVVGGS